MTPAPTRFGMAWHGPLGAGRRFVARSTPIEPSMQAVSGPHGFGT